MRLNMIPQDGYRGFVNDNHKNPCDCGMCIPVGLDWSDLSNSEKLTKMIILKAQIAAETNASNSRN